MSKTDKDGWIRHRGGKQPLPDDVLTQVILRKESKKQFDDKPFIASDWEWSHCNCGDDVMYYREYKPAEQVEACSKPELQIKLPDNYGEIIGGSIDGPIQWRDRITTIDFDIHSLTTERAELVRKLASEGFALIGRINGLLTEAAQKHEDVGDPKNWKVGDELIAIGNCGGFSFAGEVVKILVVRDDGGFEVATESEPDHGWFFTEEESITDLKFHSRPSA